MICPDCGAKMNVRDRNGNENKWICPKCYTWLYVDDKDEKSASRCKHKKRTSRVDMRNWTIVENCAKCGAQISSDKPSKKMSEKAANKYFNNLFGFRRKGDK